MSHPAVAAYRALTRLYPRQLRHQYGADLVLLLEDQLRDESSVRVVGRTVLDLAISVPTCHLEAHMNRPSPSIVTSVLAVLSVASLLTAIVIGSTVSGLALGLLVALSIGSVALVAARRSRPLTAERPLSEHWWKFLAAGVGSVALFAAVTTAIGELPSGGWYFGMAVLFTALATVAAGLVLGVAHLARRGARA